MICTEAEAVRYASASVPQYPKPLSPERTSAVSNAVTLDDPLSNFPVNSREIIRLAIRLGWRAYFTKREGHLVKCHSPKNEADFLVPSTNFNANRLRGAVAKIARYSDKEAVLDEVERMQQERRHPLLRALTEAAGVEPPAKEEPKTALAAAMAEAKERATEPSNAPLPAAPTSTSEPYVVASVPWLVRRGGVRAGNKGMKYESKHTFEQTMSDGSVRYKCMQCDYTNEQGKFVSWHSGQAHGANRDRSDAVTVENYGEVTHRKVNHRLMSDLIGALDSIDDWQEMSPEMLAQQIAEHIEEGKEPRPPAEPLTAEQMIERIRYIVDAERIGSMHDALASMREETQAALTARDAAVAEAEGLRGEVRRVKESLRTLNELTAEVLGESLPDAT